MTTLTQNNFKQQIQNGIYLIDFYADWCGPCRALSPILEEMDGKYPGITFAKLDIDEASGIATEYGVMSIPAIIIFRDGKEIKRIVGLNPKEEYIKALEQAKA